MEQLRAALRVIGDECKKQNSSRLYNYTPDTTLLSKAGLTSQEWGAMVTRLMHEDYIHRIDRDLVGYTGICIELTVKGFILDTGDDLLNMIRNTCHAIASEEPKTNHLIAEKTGIDQFSIDFILMQLSEKNIIRTRVWDGNGGLVQITDSRQLPSYIEKLSKAG
jgi:hypothetical protein